MARSLAPTGRGAGAVVAYLAVFMQVAALGCDDEAPAPSAAASASASASGPGGLPAEMASKVLARVGDRTITLGDYALVLERMDRFERLRYQTADRRKQLLDELVDIELLAQEAERRGLHQRPEAQELLRQVLRDALLEELRTKVPSLESIPTSDVRAYYEAHRDEFREPERRRVAAIVLRDEASAREALDRARGADARTFGKLAQERSIEKRPPSEGPEPPVELAGDLGFTPHPSHAKNDNPRVPEAVRAAAFELPEPGAVLDRVVQSDGKFYVVRLVGINAARDRSLAEADRTIRVALVREKIRKAETAFEAELREKFPVSIDEGALSRVEVPARDGR